MLAADFRNVTDAEEGDFAGVDEPNQGGLGDDRGRGRIFEDLLFAELAAVRDERAEFVGSDLDLVDVSGDLAVEFARYRAAPWRNRGGHRGTCRIEEDVCFLAGTGGMTLWKRGDAPLMNQEVLSR